MSPSESARFQSLVEHLICCFADSITTRPRRFGSCRVSVFIHSFHARRCEPRSRPRSSQSTLYRPADTVALARHQEPTQCANATRPKRSKDRGPAIHFRPIGTNCRSLTRIMPLRAAFLLFTVGSAYSLRSAGVGFGSTAEIPHSSGSVSFTSASRPSAGSLNRSLSAMALNRCRDSRCAGVPVGGVGSELRARL